MGIHISVCLFPIFLEAQVAQWVKRWPADLAMPVRAPLEPILSTVNGVPLHTAFHKPLIALM